MSENIIIAPVGEHMNDLYTSINEFPVDKIILISNGDNLDEARKASDKLEGFNIDNRIEKIDEGHVWEETFTKINKINNNYENSNLIVHTSTADRGITCAATSAAFVNGLKAIAVDEDDETKMLPVMKFSYYKELNETKLNILSFIHKNDCNTMKELKEGMDKSFPLISYHIQGNRKSDGLVDLDLVEVDDKGSMKEVCLTTMGKLLIKGYIS